MLNRAAKQDVVEKFGQAFKVSSSIMVVGYQGLTVREMEKLRRDLRAADAELKVVKNTLLRLAAENTEIEKISTLFVGPTAVAICKNDPSPVAKVFVNTAKGLSHLEIKGGIISGKIVDSNRISELSKLPSRHEMIAQLVGAISSPMFTLSGKLLQIQSKLLYALSALKESKEGK